MSLRDEIEAATAVVLAVTRSLLHNACTTGEETPDQDGSQLTRCQAADERKTR